MNENLRNIIVICSVSIGALGIGAGAAIAGATSAEHISAFTGVMAVLVAFGGAIVASSALETWREQAKGQARLSTAVEIASAVGTLKIEFHNHRAPLIAVEEYREMQMPRTGSTGADIRSEYEYVFVNRYKELYKHIYAVHQLRGKALTILDSHTSQALVELTRVARGLEEVWRMYSTSRAEVYSRDSVATEIWEEHRRLESQAFVSQTEVPTDELSVNLNEKYEAVMTRLRPYLGLGV